MDGEPRHPLIPSELLELVARRTGVDLHRGGLDATLTDFVHKRCLNKGLSAAEYALSIVRGDEDEVHLLLEAISVPHTWFFRDRVQLELALEYAHSGLLAPRCLRVWIPGCATGEDVYSVAVLAVVRGIEVSVLGTDLSRSALQKARAASYDASSFREFPSDVAAHFRQKSSRRSPHADIRQRTSFEQHNLMDPARVAPGGWDLIICRNVVIYFSKEAALRCAECLGEALGPRGALVLGAGELATESPRGLKPVQVGARVILARTSSKPRAEPSPLRRPPPPECAPSASSPLVPPGRDPFQVLLEATDLTRAMAELEAMATRDPEGASIPLCLGIAHFTRGDYERALVELDRVRSRGHVPWPTALYTGLCLERLGQLDPARAAFRQARALLEANRADHLPVQFRTLAAELLELALQR